MPAETVPPEIQRLRALNALMSAVEKRADVRGLVIDDVPNDLRAAFQAAKSALMMHEDASGRLDAVLWLVVLEAELRKAFMAALPVAMELASAGPSEANLALSPLLVEWCPARLPNEAAPCLVGSNQGHPLLTGKVIYTSQICGLDGRRRWACTVNRWYRLGRLVSLEELDELYGPKPGLRGIEAMTVEDMRDWLDTEADRIRAG